MSTSSPQFKAIVDKAVENSGITNIPSVVEKEILHHDIIRGLADANALERLTFLGGTCLRTCYGSERLSEDLDFSAGRDFTEDDLRDIGEAISKSINDVYGLDVRVRQPKPNDSNVSTWRVSVFTNKEKKHLPQQHVNIDISRVDSYERQGAMLQNHYGVDLGTGGVFLHAESQREIMADKILALALRERKIQPRDMWDMCFLTQRQVEVDPDLVARKVEEREIRQGDFNQALSQRITEVDKYESIFDQQMRRFVPLAVCQRSLDQSGFWQYVSDTVKSCANKALGSGDGDIPFKM